MIEGQTTVDPCEICGEPSVERLEVTPAVYEPRDGVQHLVKHAVTADVCALHRDRIRGGSGWQERMKDKGRRLTREAKERQRRDQLRLI